MLESEKKTSNSPDSPPCLKTGEILCRGCPGWQALVQALTESESAWRRYPVYCSATGFKVIVEDSGKCKSD
jgi:hypothetical protein